MKIAVIDYRKSPSQTALELMDAISKRNAQPVYMKAHLFDAVIKDNRVQVYYGKEKVNVDAAILRNIGLYMSLEVFLKRIGVLEALATQIPVVNNPTNVFTARDKWRCILKLALNELPVPETMVTENPFSAMRFVETKKRAVYKPITGSLGLGSALITDPDLAFNTTRSLKNLSIPSYYQAFLNKPGYDYRLFVVGDQVVGAMKRISKSSWKTNIAQGAIGIPVKESEEPEPFKLALKATKIIGLEYAGVDIAYDLDTDKYYILELNAFPQWEGLRKATGINPPDYIVEYLINKIKN
ncbi:MAG: RimK family alpha-L-glutamate ligase [Desulfurococcaceae archaeon]